MTPTDPVASLIHALRDQTVPEDADRVLNVAAARGVDQATCEALRAEWDELYRRSVTVLGGAA